MNVPLEISYKNVERTDEIDQLIRNRCDKLEEICNYISSCRVTIEEIQRFQEKGRPFRIRIDIKVPPGHEIVVKKEQSKGPRHISLGTEIRDAFQAAEQQLRKLKDKQHRDVKNHPDQIISAVVERIFKEEGYGFLRTLDGRHIYFHRNSLKHGDFERLEIGTGVYFSEEMGDEGPQATYVNITDKPGVRVSH